ncbi:uncharacterized protein HGUI_03276 [Hanseniaspora guilliermondii]|uniref:Altered inheritance of mitochondria protein 24, mitochondrial n=1 Tax=Hanseniaspora guilliermondii TaxID=56406 RepID=A0A1L0B5H8_9ASCO|nr:uncharacterized protein HGUI_03276 [Hanseniaspora guilliermondii]
MNPSRVFLQETKSTVVQKSKQTEYNILGKQKDLCQAVFKPCVPIYVKRDNLILLQANNDPKGDKISVDLSTKWLFPFASFKYNPLRFFFDPPIYHKLTTESTEKTTCLIGSNNGSTLCHLNLNGSQEWYLKPSISNRIVSLEETSTLHITPKQKFNNVNMKFVKVDGRGSIVIQNDAASSGSNSGGIYSIVLEQDESCIIKRDNLLAISGESSLELKENLENFNFQETKKPETLKSNSTNPSLIKKFNNMFSFLKKPKPTIDVKQYEEKGVVVVDTNKKQVSKQVPDFSLGLFFKMTYNGVKSIYNSIHYILYQISTGNLKFAILGMLNVFSKEKDASKFTAIFQNKFVKVSGPRTLIVQSNPSTYIPTQNTKTYYDSRENTKNSSLTDLTEVLNFNNTGLNDKPSIIDHNQKKYENIKYLSHAYVDLKKNKVLFKSVNKLD